MLRINELWFKVKKQKFHVTFSRFFFILIFLQIIIINILINHVIYFQRLLSFTQLIFNCIHFLGGLLYRDGTNVTYRVWWIYTVTNHAVYFFAIMFCEHIFGIFTQRVCIIFQAICLTTFWTSMVLIACRYFTFSTDTLMIFKTFLGMKIHMTFVTLYEGLSSWTTITVSTRLTIFKTIMHDWLWNGYSTFGAVIRFT